MILFSFPEKVPLGGSTLMMSNEISDLHMNSFLTTMQYQIFFFFCISRTMKFNHLEVPFVLLCTCIYLMKWTGPWLRLQQRLLSQKPKRYIFINRKKKKNPKPCAPDGCLSDASTGRTDEVPPSVSHLESDLLLTAKHGYFYYPCSKEP